MIQGGYEPAEVKPHVEARRGENNAANDLEALDRCGGRLVTPDDDEWPVLAFTAFASESARMPSRCHAPMVLWATGPARLVDIAERSAAVVGTRASTAYGEYVTGDISAGLADHAVTVVSGGAYGVDGAAHRATLSADGTTVAVLACGIDISYPAGHSALLHRISGSGLLVTEYPPGIRPARHRFLTRNRLVAALSGATVVVEAGLRSGAANTAAWAHALGRVVGAVPGPVTSASSAGCHRLLRRGAVVVTRAADVVELVGRIGELADEPQGPESPFDGLSDAERVVYEALPARGLRDADQIAVASALPAEQVLAPLALLEVAGLVEKCDSRWRLARR
jgi:DNA processing protein